MRALKSKKNVLFYSKTILHVAIMPHTELTLHLRNQWVKAEHKQVPDTALPLND